MSKLIVNGGLVSPMRLPQSIRQLAPSTTPTPARAVARNLAVATSYHTVFLPRSVASKQVCKAAAEAAGPTPKELAAMKREKETNMYLQSAAYMKTIGFTNQAELARVLDIATNPNSLFVSAEGLKMKNVNARPLDVDADIKPIVSFLESREVSTSEIKEVISGHPPVLSYSVTRLEELWDYLSSLGVDDVHKVILSRPSLLGLDVDANLRKIVGYLQSVDTPPETIVKYITESI